MKNILLFISFLLSACTATYGQLPVTTGLVLHLDAAIGFTNGTSTTPAIWLDQSGNGNNVQSGLAEQPHAGVFVPTNGWAGTHFPSIKFSPGPLPGVVGSYLESNAITALGTNNSTVFVVATRSYQNGYSNTLSSIADPNGNNAMNMLAFDSRHTTFNNDYSYINATCTNDHERPIVHTTVYGPNTTNLARYQNGVAMTSISSTGSPSAYPLLPSRSIVLGHRRTGSSSFSLANTYTGDMFEVVVYNRQLNTTELQQVTDYLRCKYEIFYTHCNTTPSPYPCAKGGSSGGCIDTPSFVLNFVGLDASDNCIVELNFKGTATASTTLAGYELTLPGQTPMTLPSTTTFPYQFTVNSPIQRGLLTFTAHGFDGNAANPGQSPCCHFTMTQEVMCVGHVTPPWIGFKKSTSVSGIDNADQIKIYPNPATTLVHIELSKAGLHTIIITDMAGRKVKQLQTNELRNQLSVKELAGGMYIMEVMDENNVSVKRVKFLVQR